MNAVWFMSSDLRFLVLLVVWVAVAQASFVLPSTGFHVDGLFLSLLLVGSFNVFAYPANSVVCFGVVFFLLMLRVSPCVVSFVMMELCYQMSTICSDFDLISYAFQSQFFVPIVICPKRFCLCQFEFPTLLIFWCLECYFLRCYNVVLSC